MRNALINALTFYLSYMHPLSKKKDTFLLLLTQNSFYTRVCVGGASVERFAMSTVNNPCLTKIFLQKKIKILKGFTSEALVALTGYIKSFTTRFFETLIIY